MNLKLHGLLLALGLLPATLAGAAARPNTLTPTAGVTLAVPGGWQTPGYRRAAADHLIVLSKKGEAVNGSLYTSSELRITELDTRRPRHFAERWASTWGLPLYLWGQTGQTRVTEADCTGGGLTRIVITAEAGDGEAEFLASSRLGDSAHDARLAVDALLASARDAKHQPFFPGIPSGTPQLLSVSDGGSPAKVDAVREGPFDIKIPSGWYPEELCRVHAPNLILPESYLWIIKPTAPAQSLSINWLTPADGAAFRRLAGKSAAPRLPTSSFGTIRYLTLDKTRKLEADTYPETHGEFGTFYRYISPNLVIIAHSGDGPASSEAATDAAALTVARQLVGIRIPDRDVVQGGSGFYP